MKYGFTEDGKQLLKEIGNTSDVQELKPEDAQLGQDYLELSQEYEQREQMQKIQEAIHLQEEIESDIQEENEKSIPFMMSAPNDNLGSNFDNQMLYFEQFEQSDLEFSEMVGRLEIQFQEQKLKQNEQNFDKSISDNLNEQNEQNSDKSISDNLGDSQTKTKYLVSEYEVEQHIPDTDILSAGLAYNPNEIKQEYTKVNTAFESSSENSPEEEYEKSDLIIKPEDEKNYNRFDKSDTKTPIESKIDDDIKKYHEDQEALFEDMRSSPLYRHSKYI